jgi:hypothetical protein
MPKALPPNNPMRRPINRSLPVLLPLIAAAFGLGNPVRAQPDAHPMPRFMERNGRHALIVDGAPFLILGGQCMNSSAWPVALRDVWSAIERLHANTLEAPVYWEQFEPEPGKFDTTLVDTLIRGAREHGARLVILWFGTWKNGSSHYIPLWMKREPKLYPKLTGRDGRLVDSPSPIAPATLAADVQAFRALMRHLKAYDPVHTVILVQVENESGAWGSVRDYSAAAQAVFEQPVPIELLKPLGLAASAGASWQTVFGKDADEFFHAWSVAHFVGTVAAAGKREYPLPMYANAALRDPINPGPAGTYESGGPTDNVLAIWKAAAPALDVLAPDIYQNDSAHYRKVLDLYARPDNPLFVPETLANAEAARYLFCALDKGAVCWTPFGVDRTPGDDASDPFAQVEANYRLLGPIAREVARLNFEGKLRAVAEEPGAPVQSLEFGGWNTSVSFGIPRFGSATRTPQGNPKPIGRALIAQLGENEFLVTGYFCRVDFSPLDPASRLHREFVRVEAGAYKDGAFQVDRIWNGDQTDWGLNFNGAPLVLRAWVGTY